MSNSPDHTQAAIDAVAAMENGGDYRVVVASLPDDPAERDTFIAVAVARLIDATSKQRAEFKSHVRGYRVLVIFVIALAALFILNTAPGLLADPTQMLGTLATAIGVAVSLLKWGRT
jgi:hypothetical protein